MSKTKKVKLTLAALLMAIFMCCTGVALGELVPARADDKVLSENTAEYTFRDVDGEERNPSEYWNKSYGLYDFTYNSDKNEWISPTNYSGSFRLELTVTNVPEAGTGVIAFQWKVSKLISGSPMSITVKKGDEPVINAEAVTEANVEQYKLIKVENLIFGDKVTIEFQKANQATFTIQGLNRPGKDITMRAQIQEGDEEHGTIKTEIEDEVVGEDGVLTAKRGWGESVTFTAEPQEGYAAVWYKVTGEDREFAGDGSVSLSKLAGRHNNLQFVVRFIKKGGEPEITFGAPSSKGAQWQKNDQEYTINQLTALQRGEEVNLRVLTTSKYFKFTYTFAGGTPANEFREDHYSGSPSITAYVDGTRWNRLEKTYDIGSESVETTCYVALPEGQAHIIEIEVQLSNSSRKNPDDNQSYPISEVHEGCSVLFKDFAQMDEVTEEAPTIHFYYNPHLAELTVNGKKVAQEDKFCTVDYAVSVKYLEEITYFFQKRSNVISTVDGTTSVSVEYNNTTSNTDYNHWSEDEPETLSFWKTNVPTCNLESGQPVSITDGSNELKIYQNYWEVNSLSPEVEVVQSINGDTTEAQPILGDEMLEFPWAQENSLIVNIKAFTNALTLDNFLITVNGKTYDTSNMELAGDSYIFVITDVTNLSVTVAYASNNNYKFNGKTISFSAHETLEESTLKDIVKTDELVVKTGDTSNKGVMEWQFDPYRSEEANYAYWGYLPSTTSYDIQRDLFLNFSMGEGVGAESGSISFEFQLKSYVLDGLLYPSYSGQLYYQADKEFTFGQQASGSEDGNLILRGEYKGDATFLAGVLDKGGDVKTGGGVIKQDNGWYRVSIPIKKGQTIYLAYFMGSGVFSPATDETWFSIRNLRLNTGTATIKLATCEDSSGSVKATVDGREQEDSFTVAVGTAIDLEAILGVGEKFYGWALDDGSALSTEQSLSYFAEKDCTITAYMAVDGTYKARIEGVYYKELQTALDKVEANQTVTIVEKHLEITQSLLVPKDVTLLLPYNAAGGFMETGTSATAANQISWYGTKYNVAYITVIVKNNAKITVEGILRVGGIVNDISVENGYQGHTSGAYAELILETGSKIQVAKGGVMDVYGRVWGGEGATGENMGTIDVAEGGKLYEPFLILDYAGGTNALNSFTAQTTPFKRYAMINIEVPLTINYGAQLYGHASLWIPSFNLLASLDQPFISYDMGGKLGGDGNGNDTFVMLHKGASVTITYNREKIAEGKAANGTEGIGETTMIFEGGASFSYMQFSAMSLTVPTSPVMFSIPYNFQVELNAGMKTGDEIDETYNQYETKTDFMIMPGATVKVGENTTLTLNADTWVLDGMKAGAQAGKSYPASTDLENVGYSKSGNLIVNGTLKIGMKTPVKFEISFGGSSASGGSDDTSPRPANFLGIIQTNGTTGRIEIPNDSGLSGKVWMGLNNANYFAYTTTARVWDKVHNCFGDLKAGHTYTATSGEGFTLTELNYTNAEGGKEDQKLELNSDMVGSWMIEHGENHTYDWTITEKDKEAFDGNFKPITRTCQELGCNHEGEKKLLKNVGEFTNETYKGEAYTGKELFEKLYDGLTVGDLGWEFSIADNKTLKDADSYSITVTIPEEYGYFLIDDAFSQTATFSFTIHQKEIDVKILDQKAPYSGKTPTVSQDKGKGYTVEGLFGNDGLGITITAEGLTKDVKEGGYNLTAEKTEGTQFANKNYAINFVYTHEDHSIFIINKVNLTVTADDKQSPKGEALQPFTVTVEGYVEGESNLLHENESDLTPYFTFTCSASKESTPGNYDIEVEYIGEALQNYDVSYGEKGSYTIAEAVFAKVKFENVTETYDGEAHSLKVEGLDSLDESYTILYNDVDYTGRDEDLEALLSLTDAGSKEVRVKITVGSYAPYEHTATLTINKCNLQVELLPQEKEYDGAAPTAIGNAENVGWKFANGSKMCGSDKAEDLGIALSVVNANKNAGSYAIHADEVVHKNYTVTFTNNDSTLYTINRKSVTVQIADVTMKYGESVDAHKKADGYEKTPEGIVEGESISLTLNFDAVQNKAGEYAITGTALETGDNGNYIIEVKDGKFKIEARTVTVVIEDQTDTYNFEHDYDFDDTLWSVKENEGDGLAEGEEKDVLNVILTTEELTHAGEYEITGAWDNGNYAVTFEGSKETKGKFTVEKQDVSEEAIFVIEVEGSDESNTEGDVLYVKYEGTTLTLKGHAAIFEGEDTKTLNVIVKPDKIEAVGDLEVTLTVDDENYSGEATVTVHATDARGYTLHLTETLAKLEELAKGLKADSLKAEDYGTLVKIDEALKSLSEEEREMGEADLAAYRELVDAWNDLADVEDVVKTAKTIADAPISTLFAGITALTALAAAAYIIGKGGIL